MLAEHILNPAKFIAAGLFIGIAISAPIGPVSIVCMQRTLERGFWGGVAAGIGAVLADGLVAAIAALGVSANTEFMEANRQTIELAGGVVLLLFGLKIFFTKPQFVATATTNLARLRQIAESLPAFLRPALHHLFPHVRIMAQAFFLAITNPVAVFGLLAFFSSTTSVIGGVQTLPEAFLVVVSIMAGSLLWWAGLSHLIWRIRHKVNEAQLLSMNRVTGVALIAFAGLLFLQVTTGLVL